MVLRFIISRSINQFDEHVYITIGRGRKPARPFFDEALSCALRIGAQLAGLDPTSKIKEAFPLNAGTNDQRPTTLVFNWGARRCQYVFWQVPALLAEGTQRPHFIVTLPTMGAVRYETDMHGLLPQELTRLEADLDKSRRLAEDNPSDRPAR